MSLSLYQASIPLFVRQLTQLQGMLGKAAAYCEARKAKPDGLLQARLYFDMLPLVRQVQIASDTAKGCGARLAGVENPVMADTETSFGELHERIDRTLAFLASLKPEQFEGAQQRQIELKFPSITLRFDGADYLVEFALPNFYFHVTTAYALLRHNGVELGKNDFLGKIGKA